MTDKQPEALRLAEQLEFLTKTNGGMVSVFISCGKLRQAAAKLRRLHEVNAELLAALRDILSWEENEEMTWYAKTRAALDKATGEQQ
jgi:hypothetical protein